MSTDTLLPRLEGVRRTGHGRGIARCPAHDDGRPRHISELLPQALQHYALLFGPECTHPDTVLFGWIAGPAQRSKKVLLDAGAQRPARFRTKSP
jgi:hypothetical protein